MIENFKFRTQDFTIEPLVKDEYEDCTFDNCNFYGSDLSHISFRSCTFQNCDFSLVKLLNTTLSDVKFISCKLLGVQFEVINPFLLSVGFDNCLLKLAVFNKLKLKKTHFINCNLQEAEFSETDVAESLFDNCDFHRAIFYRTNLEKANMLSSFHYSIDPETNRIKGAKFSKASVIGLLDKYGIIIK